MIAFVRHSASEIKRVMIYHTGYDVYLFGYNTLNDASAAWDKWYADPHEAATAVFDEYGVTLSDWQIIADPLDNCQHDWIAPVRIKGRAEGKPEWGHFEKLINNRWLPLHQES